MRNKLGIVVLAVASALIAFGATDTKSPKSKSPTKKTKPKGSTVKPKGADTSSAKKATAPKVASKKGASKKTPTKQTTTSSSRYRRSVQKQPSSERYQEIQQALAEKGYFKGNPDGAWGPDSVEALKSFQRNQNIGDDGKIGSMSLIALGLGPKRDGTNSAANGPPAPPPSETESPAQ